MTLSIIQRSAKLDATVAIANTVAPRNENTNERGCNDSIDRINVQFRLRRSKRRGAMVTRRFYQRPAAIAS